MEKIGNGGGCDELENTYLVLGHSTWGRESRDHLFYSMRKKSGPSCETFSFFFFGRAVQHAGT